MVINWDAFGASAEALGAIAVILSVLYLAIQIRSQTREAKLAATRDLSTESRRILQSIALDQEYSQIYQTGLYDYKTLPDNDRMRVSYAFQALLGLCEQRFLHTQHGSIDDGHLDSSERAYRAFLKSLGVQEFWLLSKEAWGADFRLYIDNLISEGYTLEIKSSFSHKLNKEPSEPE